MNIVKMLRVGIYQEKCLEQRSTAPQDPDKNKKSARLFTGHALLKIYLT